MLRHFVGKYQIIVKGFWMSGIIHVYTGGRNLSYTCVYYYARNMVFFNYRANFRVAKADLNIVRSHYNNSLRVLRVYTY